MITQHLKLFFFLEWFDTEAAEAGAGPEGQLRLCAEECRDLVPSLVSPSNNCKLVVERLFLENRDVGCRTKYNPRRGREGLGKPSRQL